MAQGQPGKQTWTKVVIPNCSPGASFDWVALYKIDRTGHADRVAFADEVRATFTSDRVPASSG